MKSYGTRMGRKKQQRPHINLQQQIKAPQKLKLLVLSGSRLGVYDFMFIMKCKNINQLDLSDNQLSSIPSQFNGQALPYLRMLYLHNNQLLEIQDIRPILNCKQLIHITLYNNPIQSAPIEHYLVNILFNLRMINDRIILQEEKTEIALSSRDARRIVFQDLGIFGDEQQKDEIMSQQKKHILRLQRQLFTIKNLWVINNPIVKFQRKWRQYHDKIVSTTKLLQEQTSQNSNFRVSKKLKACFDKWKSTFQSLKNIKQYFKQNKKQYLCRSVSGYIHYFKTQFSKNAITFCIRKINKQNIKLKKIKTVCDQLRKKVTIFNSPQGFYEVSGISQTHRILFFNNQLTVFQQLLNSCDKYMNRKYNNLYEISPCFDYMTIRPAQQGIPAVDSIYSFFIRPSMKCIFIKQKFDNNPFAHSKNLVDTRQMPYHQRLSLKMTEDQQLTSMITFQNLTKFSQSEYRNSLSQFVCFDDQYFKMLLKVIYYKSINALIPQQEQLENKQQSVFDDSSDFKFYFDKQLKRTSAAVYIQKWWKGIKSIKQHKTPPHIIVNNNRASILIQHFYRGLEYSHRQEFNMKLQRYLKQFTENYLIIEQDIYMSLSKIKQNRELYPKNKVMVAQTYVKIIWNYDIPVLSPHVRKLIENQSFNKTQVQRQGDLYTLLHIGADVSRLQFRGTRYIKFLYTNFLVARKRIAYISLMTYSFKNSGFFIKCYQKLSTIKQKQYYSSLKDIYKIQISNFLDYNHDEQKIIKMDQFAFIFPKRTLDFYINKQQILKRSFKVNSQFYHKINKNSAPVKLIQEIVINFDQLKINKQKSISVTPVKNLTDRKKSLTRPQLSLQQINFVSTSQEKIEPTVIKEEISAKPILSIMNQTSNKKQFVYSRKRVILEQKHNLVKKFRKQQQIQSEQFEKNKLGLELKNHKKVEDQIINNKKKQRSLKQMKRYTNEFIQKGNGLIKQDLMTALIRNNIQNGMALKQQVKESKNSYSTSLKKRKQKRHSHHYHSFHTQGDIINAPVNRHARLRTSIQRDITIVLPRVVEPAEKNTCPPMVHGVFTQQFYAIDKKNDLSAMFKF